jgi:hypothetical protein
MAQSAADELVVTVYLDTNALLDLLATVEDGFTLVERVTSGQAVGSSSDRSGEANFGAPGVFNFFKLGLSGKLAKSTNETRKETSESEITHTYGSLLHRLRRYLIEEKLLTNVARDDSDPVAVGKFTEFSGIVRPNPFTATFRQLDRMLEYVNVAMAFEKKPHRQQQSGKTPHGGSQQTGSAGAPSAAQLKTMSEFFHRLTSDVEREGTNTVLLENQVSGYKAIVTVYDDFLRDRSMAELLNREFRVLGKVARHLPVGSHEKVDLLSSSGISGFSPDILTSLSGAITEMSNSGTSQVAAPSTTIEPPVVEIVPIAIYL